jgi:hypothetical protein
VEGDGGDIGSGGPGQLPGAHSFRAAQGKQAQGLVQKPVPGLLAFGQPGIGMFGLFGHGGSLGYEGDWLVLGAKNVNRLIENCLYLCPIVAF